MEWTLTTFKKAAGNIGLAKVAVSFSEDTFVVTESSVLRINICVSKSATSQSSGTLPRSTQNIHSPIGHLNNSTYI